MDLQSRVTRVQDAMREAGTDVLIVSPGADLRYLTGYDAPPLERLTALILPVSGDPVLVVPALEAPEAERSPAALAGMSIIAWNETDDPHTTALDAAGTDGISSLQDITFDDHMWARHIRVFLERADVSWRAAGALLGDLRLRKNADEISSLRRAAQAIDRVHARMGEWLRVGRTERDVARDIADAIVEEGHASADFTIIAAGANAASPHHSMSDAVIAPGDPVVVDIGGRTHDGYCSDSTRTYLVDGTPPEGFSNAYAVLLEAQRQQCEYARPGVTAESVDRVGRALIEEAGYGSNFVHRTGHGIGLEVHEDPYIVEGNTLTLEPGMAFSIEPGIYIDGRHGARIEDIVVVTSDGVERLNTRPRDLAVVPG
jgi:Xaa-Pro aminopeptidase